MLLRAETVLFDYRQFLRETNVLHVVCMMAHVEYFAALAFSKSFGNICYSRANGSSRAR